MRRLFIFFIILLVAGSAESQIREISNAMQKSIEQRNVIKKNRIKLALTAMVPNKKSSFYDGQLVKRELFDTTGKLLTRSEYEAYSDSIYSVYEYAEDGYLSQITKKASANNVLTITYTYDSLGRITRITNYGSEHKDYVCKYDKRGNLVLRQGYEYYPKFDKKGKTIPNETEKILVDEIKYKYNRKNNLIQEKVKINGKHIRTTKFRYNKKNLKTEEVNKYLGNRVKYKYKYDKNLRLIEYVRYNIDGSRSYFKVEYQYYEEI